MNKQLGASFFLYLLILSSIATGQVCVPKSKKKKNIFRIGPPISQVTAVSSALLGGACSDKHGRTSHCGATTFYCISWSHSHSKSCHDKFDNFLNNIEMYPWRLYINTNNNNLWLYNRISICTEFLDPQVEPVAFATFKSTGDYSGPAVFSLEKKKHRQEFILSGLGSWNSA